MSDKEETDGHGIAAQTFDSLIALFGFTQLHDRVN